MSQEQTERYTLPDPGKDNCLSECIACGQSIVVADIESLGRCVTLICQDFVSPPAIADLIRMYQLDWVFVVILDGGIRDGGWIHQRAFELSGTSQARFMIVSSSTMTHWSKTKWADPTIGLAIGPKNKTDVDDGRAYASVSAVQSKPDEPGVATIHWRDGKDYWKQTALNVNKP